MYTEKMMLQLKGSDKKLSYSILIVTTADEQITTWAQVKGVHRPATRLPW